MMRIWLGCEVLGGESGGVGPTAMTTGRWTRTMRYFVMHQEWRLGGR